ncbi:MAG TPA: ChbG/HpnK family deacetylase [Thermoanaerobaculia bacterium]|jgi:predicted glycoside hydrolase/deacetylase ChbG (UPF0249 family)|nr:ChbG/HpnK family deacetylase [Thermoanaerobaculia bacterium]
MRRLIINADGCGFTFGNNRAIARVLEQGAIRSVSVNANFPAAEEAADMARRFPEVSFGIHWNLSVGPPVSEPSRVRTLVEENGQFVNEHLPKRAFLGQLSAVEMRLELEAQLSRLRSYGLNPTHWDSHQHRHVLPGFFAAAVEVAKTGGIRAARSTSYYLVMRPPRGLRLLGHFVERPNRVASHLLARSRSRSLAREGFVVPDFHVGIRSFGEGAEHDPQAWAYLFSVLPRGIGSIAVHPGYPDETLKRYSSMIGSREREVELFEDFRVGRLAKDAGVELIGFNELLAGEMGAP